MGRCRLNAYCVPIDQDPPCVCLPGFVFVDQRQRDLGCRRYVSTIGCPDENKITYSIADLDGLVWENTPYFRFPLRFGRTGKSGSTMIKVVTESSGTKTATKGFSDQVGKRAFGTFYKRVIPSNGGRVVAIKKLEKVMDQGDWAFRNEMNAIGRTHHKNLVKLLGYYHDGSNRLLVYEYMTNGFKLFNSISMFMDEEAMDESTHNLLLSAKLNALQVIADELDKLVKDEDVDKNELRMMVKVGLWCIQDELAFRPSMNKIILMLEGTVEIPNPPSFTSISSSIS
ncbi:hypothetical protein ACFX13_034806 [Malus domestica]